MIRHTPHPDRVISQIRCFSKAGTTIKIVVYHRYAFKVLSILVTYGMGKFWRLEELVARHSEAQTGCPITFTYRRRAIRDILERCDFRVTEI